MQTPPANHITPPSSSGVEVVDHQTERLRMIFEELVEVKELVREVSRASSGYAVVMHRDEAVTARGGPDEEVAELRTGKFGPTGGALGATANFACPIEAASAVAEQHRRLISDAIAKS